jgi:hypothetical protein
MTGEQLAIDVWLRHIGDEEEAEAEANTYRDGDGFRVEWYLNSVGLVTEVQFATYEAARDWLTAEGFQDFTC